MNTNTVPRARLSSLTTEALIAQYDLALTSTKGRYSNYAPRQKRINFICDMLLARAESGDALADDWFANA